MSRHLLDTNIISNVTKPAPSAALVAWMAEQADEETGRHDFLIEIAEYGVHDLAISGAEYLLDDGEVRGIVRKGQRRVIAYRQSALVVPAGNPAAE